MKRWSSISFQSPDIKQPTFKRPHHGAGHLAYVSAVCDLHGAFKSSRRGVHLVLCPINAGHAEPGPCRGGPVLPACSMPNERRGYSKRLLPGCLLYMQFADPIRQRSVRELMHCTFMAGCILYMAESYISSLSLSLTHTHTHTHTYTPCPRLLASNTKTAAPQFCTIFWSSIKDGQGVP